MTQRRQVTDKERAQVIEAADQGIPAAELCRKFKRARNVIDRILARRKSVALTLTNKAIEQANNSALTVGTGNLIDMIKIEEEASNQPYRVKRIIIDVDTRECEAIVERKLSFRV